MSFVAVEKSALGRTGYMGFEASNELKGCDCENVVCGLSDDELFVGSFDGAFHGSANVDFENSCDAVLGMSEDADAGKSCGVILGASNEIDFGSSCEATFGNSGHFGFVTSCNAGFSSGDIRFDDCGDSIGGEVIETSLILDGVTCDIGNAAILALEGVVG